MPLIINRNLPAMNAARNLGTSYGRLETGTQRLTTGLRMSSGKDAVGLSIGKDNPAQLAKAQIYTNTGKVPSEDGSGQQ